MATPYDGQMKILWQGSGASRVGTVRDQSDLTEQMPSLKPLVRIRSIAERILRGNGHAKFRHRDFLVQTLKFVGAADETVDSRIQLGGKARHRLSIPPAVQCPARYQAPSPTAASPLAREK